MSSSAQSKGKRGRAHATIYEMTVFSMLATVMFVSKELMEVLPNIHLLGMLIIVYTHVYRQKALIPIYIYVFLDGLFSGFSGWWIPYLYIWTILWGVAMLVPRNTPRRVKLFVFPLLSALHGFSFGILYSPAQAIMFGLDLTGTLAWISAGIPFDLIHGVSNLFSGMLALPLCELLLKLESKRAIGNKTSLKRSAHMLTDLHLHTTYSDGTLTPGELISYLKERRVGVFSITDHDTTDGISEAIAALPGGMTLIPGIEFSCIYECDSPFLLHLLGYGIDISSEELRAVIAKGHEKRLSKHSDRLLYLEELHGIRFTDEEKSELASAPSVGRLHIAGMLVKKGLASDVRDAINRYMSAEDFPDGRISAGDCIRAIIAAGGIPVYAHPLGGECDKRLSPAEAKERISLLKSEGIMGIECYYSRYTRDEISALLRIAEELGLLTSGGSDFHGKNKDVDVLCLCSEGTLKGEVSFSVLDKLFCKN